MMLDLIYCKSNPAMYCLALSLSSAMLELFARSHAASPAADIPLLPVDGPSSAPLPLVAGDDDCDIIPSTICWLRVSAAAMAAAAAAAAAAKLSDA
jgi:hypothetical protein